MGWDGWAIIGHRFLRAPSVQIRGRRAVEAYRVGWNRMQGFAIVPLHLRKFYFLERKLAMGDSQTCQLRLEVPPPFTDP